MAKTRRRAAGSRSAKVSRWGGLILLALGAFLTAALLTFQPDAIALRFGDGDPLPAAGKLAAGVVDLPPGPLASWTANAGGAVGILGAAGGLWTLGWVFVWGIPVLAFSWGANRLRRSSPHPLLARNLVAAPIVAVTATLFAAMGAGDAWAGRLGSFLWSVVHGAVGPAGGILVLVVAGVGFFALEAEVWSGRWGNRTARFLTLLGLLLIRGGRVVLRGLRTLWRWGSQSFWARPHPEAQEKPRRREPAPAPVPAAEPPAPAPVIVDAEDEAPEEAPGPPASARAAPQPPRKNGGVPERPVARVDVEPQDVEAAVHEARRHARQGTAELKRARRGRMVLPGTEILDDVPEIGPPVAEQELLENSQTLTETLRDFGITGRVGEVHPGPVITRYEFQPGPGVKVAQIQNRQDDLALKLRATRIRILAPIPGKAAVGVEVPNRTPSPIFLRRLLETHAFRDSQAPLPLALGRDIGGAPVITELSKMPHLLIAGTTGSGKSVCMNALITSLLLKRTPDELRLLMVDPKMLELPMYNGIPHLLTDVVTEPKLAAKTLKWLLIEMERRYRVLAARGCRNIQSYNAKMDKEGPLEEGEEKLPFIVVFIDELADLMITSGNEVEEPIARLAQTARAVGIHLIVATQRPSVDVITGVIKANFPTRIAFQVATRHDSRTILDQNGAESLLGKGDMLFLPPGTGFPLRVHGAFVSEAETQRLAEAWRHQGEPEAHEGLEAALAEQEGGLGGPADDPLFEDAARLVVAAGQASASMLQRRLKVGYARAARLVDMLESAGVVSSAEGSKPRDILVDEVRLEHVLAGTDA